MVAEQFLFSLLKFNWNHFFKIHSSLFIGFIIFAIPLIIKEEKENIKETYKNLILTLIEIIIVSAITYFNPQTGIGTNIDITSPNIGLFIYVFIAGIALIIKVVKKVLEKYRSQTIYLIIGLMIGSIYAIIMGATTLKVPQEPLSFSTFGIVYFIIGGLLILGMEVTKRKLANKENS